MNPNTYIPCMVLGLCGLAGHAVGQTVNYVERSAGLQLPGLENGRTELEFGDVNGDGHPDIVSVGDHGNPGIGGGEHGIMVWFGDGGGTWSFFQTGDLGYGGVALGDVNLDGLMDIGYGIHHNYAGQDLGDQILEVALGDGTGTSWLPWDDGLASAGETWGMFDTDFADVDNDGDLDVGSISFGCCAGLHVYLNNRDGTWTHGWGFLGGNASGVFVFGDVNGDGFVDFASGHGTEGTYIADTVYIGDGQGGFTLADGDLPPVSFARRGAALGDVNGDGRDDLAWASNAGVHVYTLASPGHWQNLSGSLATIGNVWSTQIVDMNLDGHGDIVAVFQTQTVVYTGDGQGNWQAAATIPHYPNTCGFAALRAGTDIDHNGHPDLAFVLEENCQWWIGGTNRLRCFAEASTPDTPWIHPKYPRGGQTLIAGSVRFIDWYAAVPPGSGHPPVSIALSTAGPDGPFTTIADQVPNSGRFQWTVPAHVPTSATCYLRFTMWTDPPASATTPAPFTILNLSPITPGDTNCDGAIDFDDIDAFVAALEGQDVYQSQYPHCDWHSADCDGDGDVDFDDIDPFVALLGER